MVFQHRLVNSGECPSTQQWVEDKTLKSEPKDPWGHPLLIVCPGQHEEGGADISSLGPDGQSGTKDDIESWKLP
jgi:general secretion pathway protein G